MKDNLISQFMKIEKKRLDGLNSDVVFMTNKELGTHYQQGRFKEWEDGRRKPTVKTHNFMLRTVLTHDLLRVGLNKVTINRIIKNSLLIEEKK
ncbi:hypothetical protein [uncultured Gammaproteobacteria bacterium]|uniref:hypothetical protein n=1 Tax=Bathymodiolus heckerae thiotrophic gill symbiont TaxID=1052212 RepID=UPI0010B2C11E|nr:hypothetical protein [Bathymodiolus heckerae thiotrophic gill symbiont]CAC9961538.1 hypothetical protein [uncultured Gammaproteobacteria bacterium]SHN92227.1 hypothetical protein BHECKSOX_380 [Bathymodiolus heckerae thiotrophic gill symbiont]